MLVRLSLAAAAIIAAQPGPIMVAPRPVVEQQSIATPGPTARKQRILKKGRELLGRADMIARTYVPGPGRPTMAELAASRDQLKSELDSMSEMSEMDSMRLQMAMDRLSKMMSTLSNILKKTGDTQDAITNNMK